MKYYSLLLTLPIFLSYCNDANQILKDRNFEAGNWLLVNVNYVEKTLEVIDREDIFKNNQHGLWLTPLSGCSGTTCDGFLMLYQDGKLVAEQEYLTRSSLYESRTIKAAYQKGSELILNPIDKNDFDKKWDSVIKYNYYPTIYHTQPEDKDIIWAYKVE